MRTFSRGLLLLLLSTLACGDIVTDGSLGPAMALNGPDFQITAGLGQQRGGNLFHSFSQFNIASTESATFSGPLGRITSPPTFSMRQTG